MPNPTELTAAEAARAIAGRQITAIELAEACLERIDALDDRLRAWVYVDRETVLADAKAADAAVSGNRTLGPLHGVPIGMKDIYYTAGIPTRAGSEVYKDFVPDYDATSLKLLKRAGAIMLGKAVTTEFACLDPSPTFNPWNAAHTPGGSSSGSAVAVASRMCPAAMGSQTVGSVLRPAAYNGVVGFKPTFGRVSRYGVVPVSWNLDTVGWLVRTVEDAALLLQVMAGPDGSDSVSSREPVADYLSAIQDPPAPRIGLLRRYFYEKADTETRRHFDGVADLLAQAGAEIEELPMPDSIESAFEDQMLIMSVEAAAFHEPMYREQAEDYQPKLRAMLAAGLQVDGITYTRALERRREYIDDMQQLAERCDVLLTPATPEPPRADRTNTGNPAFQGPWTSCGLPAIALPSGLAESGLPLGIQMVASPFAEARLLAAARWCEDVMGVNLSPPV
ncbi:MAG: amidase [Chloroflexota bacterium]|nr:amidase [Chloroflexota bacterium]